MSQVHRRSARDQDGSLTSEADSMSDSAPTHSNISKGERLPSRPGSIEHQRSVRVVQRNLINTEKGPDMSTPVKASFASECENEIIQDQRNELGMLMRDLKSRDRELDEMVAAHQNELLGWKQERQRSEQERAESNIKEEQVRALTARLKTMASVQQTKQAALDHSRAQTATLTEQLTQSYLKLKDTQKDNKRQMSKTLEFIESKEQEMLCLLTHKDRDLTTAAAHLSELRSKLKLLDNKVKSGERAEAEGQKTTAELKQKHFELKRVTDKLKCDLNQSQLDEEESRAAVERTKREQERLRKQILNMADREKRLEERIHSQQLKQERIDTVLSSERQLYVQQQLDLDAARETLTKHRDCCTENRTVAYYTGETTITLPAGSRLDSSLRSSISLHSERRIQGLISALDPDHQASHLSGVRLELHQHTNTDRNNSSNSASYSPVSAVVERLEARVSGQKQRDQQQQQQSESTEAQPLAGTPQPGSAIPQYSGRSLEKNTTGSAPVLATLSASSDAYGSRQVMLEKRYYKRETQSGQEEDDEVVQRVETRQVSNTEDVVDRAAGASTPPPLTLQLNHCELSEFRTSPRLNLTAPAGGAGLEDSVRTDHPEQLPDTSARWTDGSLSASSDSKLHSYNNMELLSPTKPDAEKGGEEE